MATARGKKASTALAALGRDGADLATDEARATLRAALIGRDAGAIAEAARLIAEHARYEHESLLVDSYRALTGERVAADPGCLAKEALLAALDALEHSDGALFADAALYEQPERDKTGTRDSGGRVRARGVLGLARLGHRDWLPILGTCLGDADPSVRLAAARAIAHREQRDGAGLLLLRLGADDDQPDVLSECLRGAFLLAPELAVRKARALLGGRDARRREQTLQALGVVPHDDAVVLLMAELEQQPLPNERRAVIEALGLSLRPSARAHLLEILRTGRETDAEAALSALSIHRYHDALVSDVREAVAHSRSLSRLFAELFAPA